MKKIIMGDMVRLVGMGIFVEKVFMTRIYVYAILFSLLWCGCMADYENDGKAVYYKSGNASDGFKMHRVKLNADTKTFRKLKHQRYAKDKSNVFFDGKRIEGADAASFESISQFFAKDKNRGYRVENPIPGSKGLTFRTLDNNWYSTDGNDIFLDTTKLHVCSVENFRFVFTAETDGSGINRWTTDGCHYYYGFWKVPSNDYESMTVYPEGGGISKDEHFVYFLDHKMNYNMEGEKVVDTIDAASFEVTGFLQCRDKWGCFKLYHGRVPCLDK